MSDFSSNSPSEREPDAPAGPSPWRQPKQVGFFGMVTRLLMLIIIATGLVLPFTPFAGKIKRGIEDIVKSARQPVQPEVIVREVSKEVPQEVVREVVKEVIKEVEVPVQPPLPSKYIDRKDVDVASLFNGITVKTNLITEQGSFASLERLNPEAYKAEFQLNIRVPKANQTLADLARINSHLPKVLPGLEATLATSKVSPFYHKLYENKTRRVQMEVTRLNRAMERHNFFDCETILELTHPTTKRRAMLIQSEMDVVADGSDGDRMPKLDEYIFMSDYYQPFTSYAWSKRTPTPNPLLAKWESRLAKVKAEYAVKGLSAARNAELKASMKQLELEIADMKARSSLIAEKDPFVVISLLFRGYEAQNAHTPRIGDYAVVIYGDKLYPAICGDYGPSFKMGEASLMMAKTINAKATPYVRPESDLKVTYLVFPGTGEKPWGPPDLKMWEQKVVGYLNEMGGIGAGYTLHSWPVAEVPPAVPEAPATPATPVGVVPGATPVTTPAPGATPATAPVPVPVPVPAAGTAPGAP